MRALPLLPLLAAGFLSAQTPPAGPSASVPVAVAEAIAVDQVRPGMTGYGESVFAGSETERFEVEILGVLRDLDPGTSYIVGRLSGKGLERTGVVAGMSGSPVWIDGRLAGAVAFSWPFSQEAIAGITPIGSMRALEGEGATLAGEPLPAATLPAILGHRLPEDLWRLGLDRLASGGLAAGRSALLWSAAGMPGAVLDEMQRALPTLSPVLGGRSANATEPASIVGGSSVSALLIDGDFRMAAVGTVTERDGDRVLAFGHPLADLGPISIPMAGAEVVTVLGSSYSSFKLANSGTVVGEFTLDRKAGLAGHLGRVPGTVPYHLAIGGAAPRVFDLRLARVPDLLAVLSGIGAMGGLGTVASIPNVRGLDLRLAVDLGEEGRIELEQSFDGPGSAARAASFTVGVVDYLARSELAHLEPRAIDLDLTPFDEPRATEILDAHALRSRVRPGERAEIVVSMRGYRGAVERHRVAVEVPEELNGGTYVVLVGDGASMDAVRLTLEPPAPRSFAQAKRLLASLGSARDLAVLGLAPGLGAAAGGDALPRLPPSVSAIWAGGAAGERPVRIAILRRDSQRWPVPLAGMARVDLTVESTAVVPSEPAGTDRRRGGKNGGSR